jgi:hypothetical protein
MEHSTDLPAGLTRRAAIKGAGAAVALGAAGSAAGPAVAERAGGAALKPPFDVRDQVQDSNLDAPAIQALYDDVNRLVLLIGDIPLRRLFRTPMSQLVPEIAPRVQQAAAFGLIADPAATLALATQLQQQAPGRTLGDFFARSRREIGRGVLGILVGLRRQGIRIPLPNSGGNEAKARALVIRRLVRAAPNLTFGELQTIPKTRVSGATRNAIAFAKANGLLDWQTNDRCCDHKGYNLGNRVYLDLCRPNTGTFCAYGKGTEQTHMGITYGICTAISDDCPAGGGSRSTGGR